MDNALLILLKNTENLFRFLKGRMISASQLLERFYLMPKNSMIMWEIKWWRIKTFVFMYRLIQNQTFLDEPTNDLDIVT
jgi:hypothetical protein